MRRPLGVDGWVAAISCALVAGVVLGVLTQMLQGALPDNAGTLLANSGAAWAAAAFGVGAVVVASDAKAAAAGALALVTAAITFYQAVAWFENSRSGLASTMVWVLAGLVAGPVFGVAGRWARVHPARRPYAVAVVAGVLYAEGAHLIWWVGVDNLRVAGVVELIAATLLSVLCLRPPGKRWLVVDRDRRRGRCAACRLRSDRRPVQHILTTACPERETIWRPESDIWADRSRKFSGRERRVRRQTARSYTICIGL